jgi:hypothetical protein
MKIILSFFILLIIGCNTGSKKQGSDTEENSDSITRNKYQPGQYNIEATELTQSEVPPEVRKQLPPDWVFEKALKWTDKNGNNMLITYSEITLPSIDNHYNEILRLNLRRFKQKDSVYELAGKPWSDSIQCPQSFMRTEFINDSYTITDLDKDGIAEVKIQYISSCGRPVQGNFVLFTADTLYTLRGLMWLDDHYGKFTLTEDSLDLEKRPNKEQMLIPDRAGLYTTEKDFNKAPPIFLQFARSEWLKHIRMNYFL